MRRRPMDKVHNNPDGGRCQVDDRGAGVGTDKVSDNERRLRRGRRGRRGGEQSESGGKGGEEEREKGEDGAEDAEEAVKADEGVSDLLVPSSCLRR